MSKKKNYDNWSKEELIKELERIKETKYGLIWHRDKEAEEKLEVLINVDAKTPKETFSNEISGKPFPVLKEVKDKQILTNKKKPVDLLIEGDNYHSLAVLNFTHQEAIDFIYIDPPYNTGNNDFIYNDKIVDSEDPFRHSKWLSFMEKRLKLAKFLLKNNGVIFISIDDNEQAQLKLLCDEIFGYKNFIATLAWNKKNVVQNDAKFFSVNHEYLHCYAKEIENVKFNLLPRSDRLNATYKNSDNDHRGPWVSVKMDAKSGSEKSNYSIKFPNGVQWTPTPGRFPAHSKEKLMELYHDGRLWFGKNGNNVPRLKVYLSEVQQGVVSSTLLLPDDVGSTQMAKETLKKILNQNIFETPKPVELIKRLIRLNCNNSSTILDFMAGSGTTGQAVLELNEEDNGSRNFILCTNNENKICSDVCYPRLKKIIKGYKDSKGKDIKGLGGNLKYFTAYDFVEAKETDQNKRKLVNKSTEMLCIKENAFELIKDDVDFKIFKNHDHYLGIVFYEEAINDYKKEVKKINGIFNTYVFSLGDDPHEKQFSDVKNKVSLCAIPEVILKIYREIFK
ncbi:site-specific DNA-methyltransferase [Candidatus Falkowbacteria bacterium]|nr:site-specific DNA-methyltransferase [Candidatus Falkowbacteria bacterium]